MKDITKFLLCAGIGSMLNEKERKQVRAKFDTERVWEDMQEVLGRVEDKGVEFTIEMVIEAMADAFPEYRLSENEQSV